MIYLLIALACSFLGAAVIIITKVLSCSIPVFAFTFLRFGIAWLCFLPFLFAFNSWQKIRRQDIPYIFFLGISHVLIFNTFFIMALERSSPITISIISALHPIITMILTACMFCIKPSSHQCLAFFLSFTGAALVITNGNFNHLLNCYNTGSLFMLIAVISQVVYALVLKKISAHYSPLYLTFLCFSSGLICALPFIEYKEALPIIMNLNTNQWLGILSISVLGTALAFYLYSIAIKHLGPTRTSLIAFSTIPIFTFILAYIFLGEAISIWQIIGGLLVISSVALGLRHIK